MSLLTYTVKLISLGFIESNLSLKITVFHVDSIFFWNGILLALSDKISKSINCAFQSCFFLKRITSELLLSSIPKLKEIYLNSKLFLFNDRDLPTTGGCICAALVLTHTLVFFSFYENDMKKSSYEEK